MDIVIVTSYWRNSPGGGIKKYIVSLTEEFISKGASVRVIFREGSDPKNIGIPHNTPLFCLIAFIYLIKLRPSVIQTMQTWYCMLPAVLYKKLFHCKVVGAFHTEPEKNLPWAGKVFMQSMINNCDCVTFGSRRLVDKIEEIWGLHFNYIEITPAGIRPSPPVSESTKREFKEKFSIGEQSIVILAMGLTALKHKADGAKLLIRSIESLRKKYPSILLILTREGNYSKELINLTENENLSDNVLFTGDVDDPSVPLSIADIYVHTPLGEGGVPQSLLEAMIMAKPVVATNVGGIPEAIENNKNGILVNPDISEITEKIDYILENPSIAKTLGENAKKTAHSKFSWESLADRFFTIYGLNK